MHQQGQAAWQAACVSTTSMLYPYIPRTHSAVQCSITHCHALKCSIIGSSVQAPAGVLHFSVTVWDMERRTLVYQLHAQQMGPVRHLLLAAAPDL